MRKNNKKVQTISKWSIYGHNMHDDGSYFYSGQQINTKPNTNIVMKNRKCGEDTNNNFTDSDKNSDNDESNFENIATQQLRTKGKQLDKNSKTKRNNYSQSSVTNSECNKGASDSVEDYSFCSDEPVSLKMMDETHKGTKNDSSRNKNFPETQGFTEGFTYIETSVKEKLLDTKVEIKDEIEQMINNMANMIQNEILSLKEIKASEYLNVIQSELKPINEKLMKMEESIHNKSNLSQKEFIANDNEIKSKPPMTEKKACEDYFDCHGAKLEPSIKEKIVGQIKNQHSPELNKSIQNIIFEAQRNLLSKVRMPISLREIKKSECDHLGISLKNVNSIKTNGKLYPNEINNLKRAYYPNCVMNMDFKTKNFERHDQYPKRKDDQLKAYEMSKKSTQSQQLFKKMEPGIKTAIIEQNYSTLDKKVTSQSLARTSKKSENYYTDTNDLLFSKSKFNSKLEDLSKQIKTPKTSS